jgi:hypothetical protein
MASWSDGETVSSIVPVPVIGAKIVPSTSRATSRGVKVT